MRSLIGFPRARVFTALAAVMLVQGCAASRPPAVAYTPQFDFTPPTNAAPGSAGVVFALVLPRYAEGFAYDQDPLLRDFADKLGLDFQELLSARGFNTKGPYRSRDLMTYPDKQTTDLVLFPELAIISKVAGTLQLSSRVKIPTGTVIRLSGTEEITGRVTLAAIETLSGERMWVKSIELPPRTVPWTGTVDHRPSAVQSSGSALRLQDPGFRSAVGRAMEEFYPMVLKTAWDYLDPAEMKQLKRVSDDLKKKWVTGR